MNYRVRGEEGEGREVKVRECNCKLEGGEVEKRRKRGNQRATK